MYIMKFIRVIILIISLILTFLDAEGQVYDYPIQPGTSEWKQLNSTEEKIEVCQIPASILSIIQTDDLLEVCLRYPLLLDFTASNSPYLGFLAIVETFNGLKTFLNRSDASDVLLAYYENYDIGKINGIEELSRKGRLVFEFTTVELLLCQPNIMEQMAIPEKRKLLSVIMDKYKEKIEYEAYFGFYGKMTTAFLGNRVLESIEGKGFSTSREEGNPFHDTMLLTDTRTIDKIIAQLQNYVK